MSPLAAQLLEATKSWARVFAAASLAVYLERGVPPLDLAEADWRAMVNAGLAALLVTAFNALRPGEHRFGRGAGPEPRHARPSRTVTRLHSHDDVTPCPLGEQQ